MKSLSDARMPEEPSCTYCRMGAPDLCRCAPTTSPDTGGEDLDLYDDKVQAGIVWTMRQWGEALGLTAWTQGDGSESVEGDVGAEIHTILVDAGLRCPETNDMATLATPTPRKAEGVLVPREPTEAMIWAGALAAMEAATEYMDDDFWKARHLDAIERMKSGDRGSAEDEAKGLAVGATLYRAMLDAAPTAEVK